MRSGRLRYLVTLQRPAQSQARKGSGQVKTEFEDVADVYAEIMPGRGREFFAAAQIQATAPGEIRIRYRDDIDETWRVKHITRYAEPQQVDYWQIAAPPIPDAKTGRRDLLLMCNKGRADGWRT